VLASDRVRHDMHVPYDKLALGRNDSLALACHQGKSCTRLAGLLVITEMNEVKLALFGMQNRTLGPYL
jgi:hypothetical protein